MSEVFRFDEKKHVYTLDGKPLMGCTSVLSVISKPMLIQWAANEAVKHVGKLSTFIDDLPDVGRVLRVSEGTFNTILEEARHAHRQKKETAGEAGIDLHALAEGYVRLSIQENEGKPMDVCPAGLELFRDWAKAEAITFVATEKRMYSKSWWIAGTADIVFKKDDKLFVADIKTYAKIWDRVPFFQCAGYANMFEEMSGGKEKVDGYCVLRISKDGTFEAKWSFDTVGDTKAFFACVELYRQLQAFNQK